MTTDGESRATPGAPPVRAGRAGEPLVSYALGYGGNGITFGLVAADILANRCLGRPNEEARLFRLDR